MDYQIAEFLSKLLGAPTYVLTPQHVLTFFAIPFFLMWFAFYLFLKRLRIFRTAGVINIIITGAVAFFGIRYGFGVIGGIAAICYFLFHILFERGISLRKRILYIIILGAVAYVLFGLLPYLIENWSMIFPY